MGREVHQRRNELRLFSWMAIAIIVTALAFLLLLLIPGAVGGTITGDQPPASGDWHVRNDTTVTGEIVVIDGDLIVEADLVLRGSVLRLDVPGPGSTGINVTTSGSLDASNSTIESASWENYTFSVHGEMDLYRVTVADTFWGIQVRTDGKVVIDDVLITDMLGRALLLEDADGTTIRDLRIYDEDFLTQKTTSFVSGPMDIFLDVHDYLPGLIVVSGGSPSIDGIDISVNGTLEYRPQYDQAAADGGIDIELEWPVFDVNTKDPISISDVWFRESRLQLKCLVTQTQTIVSTVDVQLTFLTSTFLFRNYRDATVQGLELTAVWAPPINLNVTSAGSGVEISQDWVDRGNMGIHAFVDERFTNAGPHTFKLTVEDVYLFEDALLWDSLTPGYSGPSPPTFEHVLLVDNVTLELSGSPTLIELEPTFNSMKTFDLDITFSYSTFNDSTFSTTKGPAIDFSYRTGPVMGSSRSIVVRERTSITDCDFRNNGPGDKGIIRAYTNLHGLNQLRSELTVHDCHFHKNAGTLLNITGGVSQYHDRLVVNDNLFENNTCSGGQRLMYVAGRTEVEIFNNSFFDNRGSNGILLYDPGGYTLDGRSWYRYPCSFNITNNSFNGNLAHEDMAPPRAFIDLSWGGVVNVVSNIIARTGSDFISVSDFSNLSRESTFTFTSNSVTENDHNVLYFTHNGRNHSYLDVMIHNNTVRDNMGALAGYLSDPEEFQYNDYGATFLFSDNDVSGAGSTVFSAYGNITVSGNSFTDCVGWVLRLEQLRMYQPHLVNNTFVRCGDAILIRAKDSATVPVLLWMDNNVIDSNGTAIEYYYMEVTLRNTIVIGTPYRAVVSYLSYVDAYDCDFEMDDCEVVADGYIRMWYWVEAWVRWASKDGVATTNPVVDANVTFVDQAEVPSLTTFADGEGHMPPSEVLAWHIEHASAPVQKTPYTIVVSLSSFRNSVEMEINRSHRGIEALELLLWDPVGPIVSIDSPENMTIHNTLSVEISGFATDTGSGVHTLKVELSGGAPKLATPESDGTYHFNLTDVPEGWHQVVVTVADFGGNLAVASITIEVDRTPPRLVVTYPQGELHTNASTVNIQGEVEAGTELTVNMVEYPSDTGAFDLTLPLNEGTNYFGLTATDDAGNSASVVIWVVRDTHDPLLELYDPADGLDVNRTQVLLRGMAEEFDSLTLTLHRSFTDVVDRPINTGEDGSFEVLVDLEEGVNQIVVTVRDTAGNTVTLQRTVILDTTPPTLELLSPEEDLLLNVHQVTVVFTVSADAEQVYVNGKRVLGTGQQETVIMLGEGENPITVWAVDGLWNRVSASVTVYVDTTSPTLELTRPAVDSFKTNDPSIEVRGVARDEDLDGLTVTVDGHSATVTTDGSFYYLLTLEEDGSYIVSVVSRDGAGNTARTSFTVDLLTEEPTMSLHFSPAGDRLDPGTVLHVEGASTRSPLNVTIVHDAAGNRQEFSFIMINASFDHYLNLVKGINSVTVRSEDEYGNWNVTAPYVVDVREKEEQEPSDSSTVYLISAVIVATALIVVSYIILRRP